MAEDTAAVRSPYQPDAVMNQLEASPQPRSYNCERLLQAHKLQKQMIAMLKAGIDTLDGMDTFLLLYLRSLYFGATSLRGSDRNNMLEMSIIKTGFLAPFITDIDLPTKRLEIGLPTNPEAVSDNLSEVVRITAAAYICKWHYLNFRHHEEAIPSDDAALLLSTLAIRSLSQEGIAEAFETRASTLMAMLAATVPPPLTTPTATASTDTSAGDTPAPALMPQPDSGIDVTPGVFGAPQLRWLMHWLRGELCGYFADVQYILGDDRFQDSLVAQQADWLSLIKQVPADPMGYALYSRACMRFQQTRPAAIFATKGLTVAVAQHEEVARAQLHVIRAVALLMGGSGATSYKPAELAASLRDAREQLVHVRSWLPECYHDLLSLSPDDTILMQQVLGLVAVTAGSTGEGTDGEEGEEAEPPVFDDATVESALASALSDNTEVPITPAMYGTRPPREMPIGALTALAQAAAAAQRGGALPAVSEGSAARAGGKGSKGGASGTGTKAKVGGKKK